MLRDYINKIIKMYMSQIKKRDRITFNNILITLTTIIMLLMIIILKIARGSSNDENSPNIL